MRTVILSVHEPNALPKAVEALQRGELVAFPTDTVYGIGAMAFNPHSVEQLYVVKGRKANKPIPILISDPNELAIVAVEIGAPAHQLAVRFWPGPLTLIVPRHPSLPATISPHATIGVRMPNHPVALELLRQTGPLAVTSANLSRRENACTAKEVLAQLGKRIPLILDGGRTPGGTPSTVVDCTGSEPVILRSGPISVNDLIVPLP